MQAGYREGFTTPFTSSDWTNNATRVRETNNVGNMKPPTNTGRGLMAAASPRGIQLAPIVSTDNTKSDAAVAKCHEYTGMAGLRKLQSDITTTPRTAWEPGCGWKYNVPGTGVNIAPNMGAYGFKDPKSDGGERTIRNGAGDADDTAGISFTMDPFKAEKLILDKININAGTNKCAALGIMPSANTPFFGFCKTNGKNIISVDGSGNALFKSDKTYGCDAKANIVRTAAGCPPAGAQGFSDMQAAYDLPKEGVKEGWEGAFGTPQFALNNQDQKKKDSFLDFSSAHTCRAPLSTDCLKMALSMAGCDQNGSIGAYINGGDEPKDVMDIYKKATRQEFNPSTTSMQNAIDVLGAIAANQANTRNPAAAAAARDLCFEAGYMDTDFKWCTHAMGRNTRISSANFNCVLQYWRQQGADTMGTATPTLSRWSGSTYESFTEYVNALIEKTNSNDKRIQAGAILRTIGTPSYQENNSVKTEYKNIDCQYTEVWGPCSVSCGTGTQTRRSIDVKTSASGNGVPCPTATTRACNKPACAVRPSTGAAAAPTRTGGLQGPVPTPAPARNPTPAPTPPPIVGPPPSPPVARPRPVDCVGKWVSHGRCDKGKKNQTYEITTPASGGGKQCTAVAGATKKGPCN